MGRGMIKKEIQALETASLEFFRNGKTETIPHIYVSLFCHHKDKINNGMISADNIFPKSNNLFALAYTICRNKSSSICSPFQ